MHKIFFTFLFFFSSMLASQEQQEDLIIPVNFPDEIKAVIFDYSINNFPATDTCGPLWQMLGIIDKVIQPFDKKKVVIENVSWQLQKALYRKLNIYEPMGIHDYPRYLFKLGILAALVQYKHLDPQTKEHFLYCVKNSWRFQHIETIGWNINYPYIIKDKEYKNFCRHLVLEYRSDIDSFVYKAQKYLPNNDLIVLSPDKQLNLEKNSDLNIHKLAETQEIVQIRRDARNIMNQTGHHVFDYAPKVMILDDARNRGLLITGKMKQLTFEQLILSQHPFFKPGEEQYSFLRWGPSLPDLTDCTDLDANTVNKYTEYLQKHVQKLPDGLAMTKRQMLQRLNIMREQKEIGPLSESKMWPSSII